MVRFKSPTESEINILNLAQTFTAHTQQHKHLPHHIAPPDTKPCVSLNLIHALLVVWRPIVLEELKKEEKKLEPSERALAFSLSASLSVHLSGMAFICRPRRCWLLCVGLLYHAIWGRTSSPTHTKKGRNPLSFPICHQGPRSARYRRALSRAFNRTQHRVVGAASSSSVAVSVQFGWGLASSWREKSPPTMAIAATNANDCKGDESSWQKVFKIIKFGLGFKMVSLQSESSVWSSVFFFSKP